MKTLRNSQRFVYGWCCLLLLIGCSNQQENSQSKPLRIGYSTWPGFDIVDYAQTAGFLKKRGANVELIKFNNQSDSTRALRRGRLDACFTSYSDLLVNKSNEPLDLILVSNISYGSDGLVVRKGINSIEELKGKRVSAKLDTVNYLILYEALDSQGLEISSVEIEDITNEQAYKKLLAGELDGAAMWEPLLSEAAQKINGKVIFTTRDVDSLVIDVMAARSSIMQSRSHDLKQFLLAWFDVMHAVDNEPEYVFQAVSQTLGQSAESFAQDYSGLKKGSVQLNKKMFAEQGLIQARQRMMKLLAGRLPQGTEASKVSISGQLILEAINTWQN